MRHTRHIVGRLMAMLRASPIVLLTGARQTGKTTLMKEIALQNGFKYVTLDDLGLLSAAQADPMGFILNQPKPLFIDEVQRAAQIALPIKFDVDNNDVFGRYALTGSANPLAAPKLNDSLAGRMMILNMWPLSRGELLGRVETFIDDIFKPDWAPRATYAAWDRSQLIQTVLVGGYPRMQEIDQEMRNEWCSSHITTILERDAQDISNITRLKEMPQLLRLLALRASQLLNVSELSRAAGIPQSTLTLYLHLLEALFLIIQQPAWHNKLSKRLTKMPKLYLGDTGLLSYLIGAQHDVLMSDATTFGPILENYLVQEIRKQSTWSTQRVELFHFRTQSGSEVDLVLENAQGQVIGIEIKSSMTVRDSDFKGLKTLADEAGSSFLRGFVLHSGDQAFAFGDNLFALPMSALWA